MISCTEFIPLYSEFFKFMEARGGHEAVVRYWERISDSSIGDKSNPNSLISFMEQYGFAMELMTQENIFVEEITPEVQRAIDMVDIVPAIAPLREIAAKQKVFQVCPYISHELEQEILPQLPECVGSRWTELFMDVNMRGIDKSIAARKVMEYYGFTMDESMAFGDGGNDVSLVKDVALGVAMGNACDALKEVADYITTGVDEDGIARALEYFELI